jgi:hypothetical protein
MLWSQTRPDQSYVVPWQNLRLYRIKALAAYSTLTHAIFSRAGGVSRAPYHSLNLSISTGDDPLAVDKNCQLVGQALAIDLRHTLTCGLVHGAEVITVTEANQKPYLGPADGLVTALAGRYLFMRFADCTPLLFHDPVKGAVGLSHAGWRGTLKNMAGATVTAMQTQLGCCPENLTVVIGPAIGPCCYEVGPEVIQPVEATFTDSTPLLLRRNGQSNRAYFDLWAANQQQLVAAGVKNIITTSLCTACHTDKFFSHRAEKGRTGRFGVVIGLKEAKS